MSESIRVVYELAYPPSKVWRALTEPALLAAWLMPNNIRAEVGHRFQFQAKPMGNWDGTVECEVLEMEPESRLVYSWRGAELDTTVAWTLEASEQGTRLTLEHSGFDPASLALQALGSGWRGKVAVRLGSVLAEL